MTGLELLSPWLLAGLGALAVPVLVHLARRQETAGRRFPSLMFVRRVAFAARRRHRLRDPWLLVLRGLALAAVVLGFAGPRCAEEAAAPAASGRDVVFLLDGSYSMSAGARWAAARAAVASRLGALPAGSRAALVLFDEHPRVLSPLGSERAALRRRLEDAAPGARGTALAPAVAAGERLLRAGGARVQILVVVSDLQRHALGAAAALELDPAVDLEIVPVTGPVGANAAVVGAELAPPAGGGAPPGGMSELAVTVRNTGDAATGEVEVAVAVEAGRRRERGPRLRLAPGAARTLRVPVVLPPGAASPVTVQLRPAGSDAIAADDRYHLVLAPAAPLAVLAVADPGTEAAVFLEAALALARDPAVRLRAQAPARLGADALAGVRVVVWASERLPDPGWAARLDAFVRDGGGLLLLPGLPPAARDAEHAWPRPMRLRTAPPAGIGPDPRDPPPVGLAPGGLAGAVAALGDLRVFRYWALAETDAGRVLAWLDSTDPLFVEHREGAGRILIAATRPARGWSTLGVEPGFAPFLHRAVRHLAGWRAPPPAHAPGDVVDLRHAAASQWPAGSWERFAAAGVVLVPPDGPPRRLAPGESLLRVAAPGRYTLHPGGDAPALVLAVNVPREESLLAAYPPAELERRVRRRGQGTAGPSPPEPAPAAGAPLPDGLAWGLVLAAALLFLGEGVGAALVASRRPRR